MNELSGTLGAIIANPIDVIKIRMMVNASLYPSIHKAFISIYREEGIAGLYKGLAPSTLRGLILPKKYVIANYLKYLHYFQVRLLLWGSWPLTIKQRQS